jgi:TM2 domain-containing membrane protein YozV
MAKNKWVSFFLCLFFGVLGAHKFYEERILLGIVYVCTAGLFGIGIFFDLIVLFFKPNPYYP